MFRKVSYIIAILAVLVLLSAVFTNYSNGSASNQSLRSSYQETISNAEEQASLTPLEAIESLNAKSALALSKTGWVYTKEISKYNSEQKNGTLPDGTIIPSEYIIESWFYVNEKGLSNEGITIMSALDATIIQTSISKNNQVWSSVTNEQDFWYPQPVSAMDFGFLNEAKEYFKKTGQEPEIVETEVGGRKVAIFTLNEKLSEPMTLVDENKAIAGIKTIAIFDIETGDIANFQKMFIYDDGSEKLNYTSEFEIQLGIIPPEDILKKIEERK